MSTDTASHLAEPRSLSARPRPECHGRPQAPRAWGVGCPRRQDSSSNEELPTAGSTDGRPVRAPQLDDNMEEHYARNPSHYDDGLVRIGCTERQAAAYATHLRALRQDYYHKVRLVRKRLLQRSGPHLRVLDVGCGLGEDIHALNRIIPEGRFVGVDLSPTAIKRCRAGARDNMEFLCGSLSELSLPAESFDLIVTFTTLEHVASPREVLRCCRKLLREDGLLVAAVPNHSYWWGWNWPHYVLQRWRGSLVRTHSVSKRAMDDALADLGLCLLDYDVVGFRPPQEFWRHIPDRHLDRVVARFQKIGETWRDSFLKSRLYLQMYVCAKHASGDDRRFFSQANGAPDGGCAASLVWTGVALRYYSAWWGRVALRLLRRLLGNVRAPRPVEI